jgi:hypothetical protein
VNGEILALYSGRKGKRIPNAGELRHEISTRKHGIVVFEREAWDQVSGGAGIDGQVHEFSMGHKKLVWLEFGEK